MRNKILRLEIEIDQNYRTGLSGKMEICAHVFTDLELLFDPESIIESLKEALKRLSGFNMLTLTLSVYEDSNYNSRQFLGSIRYVTDTIEAAPAIRRATEKDGKFTNWNQSNKKRIEEDIKDLCNRGNREFIELVRETAKA